MDCVFCKIANREIPKEFIYENENVLGFADVRPSAPVHYLFIPREHVESVMHLGDNHKEMASALIFAAQRTAHKLGLKGYKLVFNVGREGGQVINHLHLHLLGGWSKEEDIDSLPQPQLDK